MYQTLRALGVAKNRIAYEFFGPATVLGAAMLFGREFFAPYGRPLGQLVLAVLLAAYVGSLVMLRRMTLPRRRERIIGVAR